MFVPKTIGCQPRVSTSKPGYFGPAAKAVALGMAVAMLSLHAQRIVRKGHAPPNTPGNFHVTATTTDSVSFAWNPVTPGPGGSSIYEISNDTTGLTFNVGDVTSYTWNVGVQAGDTYSFHIVAVANNLASAPSPEVTVTLPGAPPTPPAVQPAAPVITGTRVTSDTITVTWTESTPANEIGSYELLVNGIEDGGSSASSTTATATGLAGGTAFTLQVVAFSKNGVTGALSTKSTPITVTTAAAPPPPANAPTAPTGLTGSGDGGGEAIISWNPSTSANEPQGDIEYDIYINGVLDINDSTVGQTTGIYIFPRGATLPAQVWVVAVDQSGNTSASNVLTLTGF
jgi:hypothetical protein